MCSYISALAWWRMREFIDEMVVTLVLVIGILMENMEHLDSRMVHVAYGVYYDDV
jgi:glycerol uptake facilitator-like aquaporin